MKNKIVLIDIFSFEREKHIHSLSKIGYFEYIEIESRSEFLSKLNSFNELLLIILDVDMPSEIDGISILEKIRSTENCSKIPIIVITKNDDPLLQSKVTKFGVSDFILKPYKFNRLQNSVKNSVRLESQNQYTFDNAHIMNLSVEDYLVREIMLAGRSNHPVSFIFYNLISNFSNPSIKGFEEIVDLFEIIRTKVKKVLRFTDFIITNNHSDILFVLPSTQISDTDFVNQKIKRALSEILLCSLATVDELFYYSISSYPENGTTIHEIMQSLITKISDKKMLKKIDSMTKSNYKFISSKYKSFKST